MKYVTHKIDNKQYESLWVTCCQEFQFPVPLQLRIDVHL